MLKKKEGMSNMKKFGWGILALLTCPCHLVLIIPLLAGTTFGTYMAVHQATVGIIFGLLFAFSMYMMFKRIGKQEKTNAASAAINCCSIPKQK
ncbi:hypothetical protein KM868_09415 [Micrococcus luteus]|nr:hypothetical protein [Micrococcus luteus]